MQIRDLGPLVVERDGLPVGLGAGGNFLFQAEVPGTNLRVYVVGGTVVAAYEIVSDEQRPAFEEYLEQVKKQTEIERQSTEHEKTGVYLGEDDIIRYDDVYART